MESNKKQGYSMPTLLKRALAYLLVTAMVISGFNMVPMTKLTAEAAPDSLTDINPPEKGRYKISPIGNGNLAVTDASTGNDHVLPYANEKGILLTPNSDGTFKCDVFNYCIAKDNSNNIYWYDTSLDAVFYYQQSTNGLKLTRGSYLGNSICHWTFTPTTYSVVFNKNATDATGTMNFMEILEL